MVFNIGQRDSECSEPGGGVDFVIGQPKKPRLMDDHMNIITPISSGDSSGDEIKIGGFPTHERLSTMPTIVSLLSIISSSAY